MNKYINFLDLGLQPLANNYLNSNNLKKKEKKYRLKVGIGRPFDASMTKHYVLKSPSISEKDLICSAIDDVVPQLPLLGQGQFQPFMHNLHTR